MKKQKVGSTGIVREGRAQCVNCHLRNAMLFASLTDQELEAAAYPIEKLRVAAKACVYSQGEKGGNIYTVRSGLIKLVQYTESGVPRIVRLLRRGDVAGLEALIDRQYRHTAEAVGEVLLCQIPVGIIEKLEKSCTAIYSGLLQRMQQNLDEADNVITQFSTGSAQIRVARFLLAAACDDPRDECEHLMREDIASLLGLTVETVSRVFAEFKRQGLLRENGDCFLIDRPSLQEIAER